MTCIELFIWLGSGVIIVPLLGFLKRLPAVGPMADQWAWILAPLLAAVLPQIATALSPYCGKVDPALWFVIYTALAYLVSQIIYYVNRKFGVSAAIGL